ncbi:hypothetical protein [Candidatus Nesciobacter abundans]|uniref:Haloacid dehalogenase-like hydrolase n=1 Tax=Candidatus Nesciobacter abundans TaxID=2601668 RepID=A0A5C0UGU9_9PROT|nr:hypothetical protein [Candidatus Nesciobacter abundans]QEK38891.1 hypothetical protein FZC36_00350 [Candidatus Nesciobacter abundans]
MNSEINFTNYKKNITKIDIDLLKNVDFVFCDLDGTLVRQNTIFSTFKKTLFYKPFTFLKITLNWILGKKLENIKIINSNHSLLKMEELDFNKDVISFLKDVKRQYKSIKIVLATGSTQNIAKKISLKLDVFDNEIYSTHNNNCIGENKLKEIISFNKNKPFMYIGNSKQDIIIWQSSEICGAVCNKISQNQIQTLNLQNLIYFPDKWSKLNTD